MAPLRIAHCIHGLGLGGAQKVIASIIRHRDSELFQHFVFSCHGGVLQQEIEDAGATVRIVERRIPKLDVSWIGALAEAMERERIDVVHTHLFGDSLHGYLASRRAGKLPVVMTLHNVFESFSTVQRAGYRWLLRRRLQGVACSRAVVDSFARAHVRPSRALLTIANGVDVPAATPGADRQAIRERFGAGERTILLAAVGRLVEQKGHAFLLRALARTLRETGADLRLVLLGEGPLGADLQALARAEGVAERTVFAGFLPDVARLLPAIDVVVFSSLHEGLPIALLEAMAAARPIVATELPSFLEALRAGEDALLVPPREVEPLAAALARVSVDGELRACLGAAAHRRFCDQFSAERMVRRYEAIYSDACAPVRRVLFVITTSDYGGAESLLERLVARLDRRLYTPVFCSLCPLGETGRRIAAAGVETLSLEMAAQARPAEMIAGVSRLARLIDAHNIDLLHAQLDRANVLATLAALLSRRRPAVVVAQHSLTSVGGRLAALAARATRPLTARIIAVSQAVEQRLTRGRGVAPGRVVVIQNGVDTERFRPRDGLAMRRELGFAEGAIVIGGVGRLSPVKGFDDLIAAVGQLRRDGLPAVLALAGDGPERGSLEAQARSMGLADAVRFLGVRGDLEAIYPAFDVFALSSLREASPMALLEAMASGCAIAASRVGGVPEMIEDGRSGLLYDRTATGALAQTLERLARSPELRRALGEGARHRCEEDFSLAAVVRAHERLYRAVLAERGRG